ncbi:uncharacterized protein LOC136037122 [Artemia franciscana]|uniref:DNA/RNA non-specific endonuclease/pyrophosphatase/phosphodiesterase domain-containing protein n=1 Tax=Artemia franciscana TaxID=6661 RepID=A0AA88I4N9_ARTSF|nr:hypothetical protein QYM36_005295 [Artemia franciscana]
MYKIVFFVVCIIYCVSSVPISEPKASCIINLDSSQRPSPSPLFFRNVPGLPFAVPRWTNDVRALPVNADDSLVLLCSGSKFSNYDTDQVIATCVSGTKFSVNGEEVSFSSLSCDSTVRDVAVRTGGICEGGLLEAVVAFESNYGNLPNLESNQRVMITICHDSSIAGTFYEKHVLNGGGVLAKDKDSSRPSFREGDFYPQFTTMSVNTAYTQKQQEITVEDILGSSSLAGDYIRPEDNVFLSRGHLAPDADFCWYQGQDATYWFLNVAPQWQVFNGGNWVQIETEVRGYAIDRDRDVTVYTGTHQIAQLADENDADKDIHLYIDAAEPLLPVPRLFWKILHDEVENTAVAFVGINNPHLQAIPDDYIICNSVCDQISFVTWDITDILKGYTYCCTTQELKSAIPLVPELGNVGLLTG